LIIQHNLLSQNSNRRLKIITGAQAKSTNKLSSGYKINRASDDAAGLSISEKMRGQIRGLNRATENMQDGISLIQTADGALDDMQSMVQRIRELSVKAANDTNLSIDRSAIQDEVDELVKEVDKITTNTEFNRKKIFNGDMEAAVSPYVSFSNTPKRTLFLDEAINSVKDNEVGIIFTNVDDYTTTQTAAGNATSTAYGTALANTLQNEIVPHAVQSLLNTFSNSLGYLSGSSVGIGLNLYSDNTSTLASVKLSAGTGPSVYKAFTLSVNVNSLSMPGGVLSSSSREELEATISHEMVHAFMDESVTAGMLNHNGTTPVSGYPSWFKEGMAQLAGGGADWVQYGLNVNSSSSNAAIQTQLGTLTSNTNPANYGVGYLACMYLGYLAGGSSGVNASTIKNGADTIMQSLVSGKSLDQTIKDYTKYSGYSDFTTNLKNDTGAYNFVRSLMSAIGSGRGSIISGNLSDTNLLSDTPLTNLALFKLNSTNDTIKNVYPAGVNLFSGGTLSAGGVKSVPEAPEAPPVNGAGPTSTVIDLSDLGNVNFAGIPGVTYNSAANTITFNGNGSYNIKGNNAGTKLVVNGGVNAVINANNVQCDDITLGSGASLTLTGSTKTNTVGSSGTLINQGTLTANVTGVTVTNSGTIIGNVDGTNSKTVNNTGRIQGNVTDAAVNNWGVITGSCTGPLDIKHYATSYTKSITAPSSVALNQNLPSLSGLNSTIQVNYNGTSKTLTGTWVVKDKNNNVVSDPSLVTMQANDKYTYELTFDGSANNIYFDGSTSASLVSVSNAQTTDGANISTSGNQVTYSFQLTPSMVTPGSSTNNVTGGINIQVGANQGNDINLSIQKISSSILGLDGINLDSYNNAQSALDICDSANKTLSQMRSGLGACNNLLEYAISNSENTAENLQMAESRIRDLDMADEMVSYSKNNILMQVGQSILAQSNQQPANVLSLFK
jgi:flagellin